MVDQVDIDLAFLGQLSQQDSTYAVIRLLIKKGIISGKELNEEINLLQH